MNGIKILGMGRSVPARVVTNDDMARIVDTSDEWISPQRSHQTGFPASGRPSCPRIFCSVPDS